MTYFPVTSSILSATHLGFFLQEKYALSKNTNCSLIRAVINHAYLVTDKEEKYVFRVYSLNWRTKEEITEEIKLLNTLKEKNISVAYPLINKEGEYIQTLHAPEGKRFAVMFSYADGEKLHNISSDTHFKIGVLMAQLHQVTYSLKLNRINYTSQIILIDPIEQLKKFLKEDTEEMDFMLTTQKFILEELSKTKTNELRQGIVHMDIWFDNFNISNKEEITLFDFDFCGNGWLCYDIAYYIMQLHNIEKYEEKEYQPKIDSFLKGYESITKISNEEKRLMPLLGVSLYFFYLGIQCQRHDNWSNSFLNENYLKRFINGLVKRYFDITMTDKKTEIQL